MSCSSVSSTITNASIVEDGNAASCPPRPTSTPWCTTNDDSAELKKNRTIMAVIHFVLTYPRWSLSLFLVLASLCLPLPSMQEAVHQPIADLRYLTTAESGFYAECVSDAFERFARKINQTTQQEYIRSVKIRQENRRLMDKALSESQTCLNASILARRSLQEWQAVVRTQQEKKLLLPVINDTNLCSAQDRNNLTFLLGLDYSVAEEEVATSLDRYLAASSLALQRMADYVQERATYDYNYFMGDKIQGTLDLLDAFSLNVSLSPMPNLMLNLTDSLRGILDALKDVTVRIDLITVRLKEFHTSIEGFHVHYVDLYERLALASVFVRDFLPDGVVLPSSFDMSGIPLGDTLLPPILEMPEFPDLNVDNLASDFIQKATQLTAKVIEYFAETAAEQVRLALEDLSQSLRELLTLEDYHPPLFVGSQNGTNESLSNELEFLRSLGQATRQYVVTALDRVRSGNVSAEIPPVLLNWNMSSPTLEGQSNAPFAYVQPLFPTFPFPILISSFFRWIWVVELVVQFVRLVRLRQMYKQQASIELPEINYLEDEPDGDPDAETSRQSKLAVIQLCIMKQLLMPWTFPVLMLFPLMIIGVALWLPHLLNSCIKTSNGTILARKLFVPLVINNASIAGTSLHASAQYLCNQNQRRACNQMFAESDILFRQDVIELYAIQEDLHDAMSVTGVIDRCIDKDYLAGELHLHCCGLEGYEAVCRNGQIEKLCPINNATVPNAAFRPVGEYLETAACHNATAVHLELEDSRFNCGALEGICDDVPCDGVDEDLLRRLTIEADCSAEVHVLKCCLLVLLSVYHALFINFCAAMAFRGVQRIRWRSLRPNGILFLTHMSADGELVRGADKSDRSVRIAAALRLFEIVGRVQVVLSLILFVVWVISFFVFRSLLSVLN